MIEIKKSLRALARDRDPGNAQWNPSPTLATYPDDYTTLGGPAGNTFFTENTIDIAGLTNVKELALQVANVSVYQSSAYAAGTTLAANGISPEGTCYEWVFVTDTPFDVASWYVGVDVSLLQYRLPAVFGDMQTATVKALSTDQVLFGRFRVLSNDVETASNVARIESESFFGDAMQTMSSKLYVYRVFHFVGAPGVFDILRAPELEVVITGMATELGDLQQIMELRRSYLTQQTVA